MLVFVVFPLFSIVVCILVDWYVSICSVHVIKYCRLYSCGLIC